MSNQIDTPPSKLSYLEKMVGDVVVVISEEGEWHGTVNSVINEDTVSVKDKYGNPHPVDIFKLRSI